jgi:hypothetical protein
MTVLLLLSSLGLLAAAPDFSSYPGTEPIELDSSSDAPEFVASGEVQRIAYFATKDALAVVAAYFANLWEGKGLLVRIEGDGAVQIVSAFETREGKLQSVVLRRHGDRTLGFLVLRELPAAVPASEDARGPSR